MKPIVVVFRCWRLGLRLLALAVQGGRENRAPYQTDQAATPSWR
ncbi:hypothetical protein BH11PSE11_BH11PSE11_19880 [soil metagenome]